jgi:hypothetical protein
MPYDAGAQARDAEAGERSKAGRLSRTLLIGTCALTVLAILLTLVGCWCSRTSRLPSRHGRLTRVTFGLSGGLAGGEMGASKPENKSLHPRTEVVHALGPTLPLDGSVF